MDAGIEKIFKYPDSRYRSCPFWAWNTRLDRDELCRQIDAFKKMGFGGFYMHSRIGLDTEYLGKEYMDAVKACARHAKENGMFAELYDDDLWPSGIAGGIVTDTHPEYRKKAILFTIHDHSDNKSYALFGRYAVEHKDGRLVRYSLLSDGETASGQIYYAYIYTVPDRTLYDTPPYGDVLDKEGVELFIRSTHEKYLEQIGDEFGKTMRTIFTDEPTFEPYFYFKPISYNKLYLDGECDEVNAPWTRGFENILLQRYGIDIKEKLPEVFFELEEGKKNLTRYYFRIALNQMFYENYFSQIYEFCEKHGIDSTGHILFEETLELQGRASGDPMLMYSKFHIPGMDLLCDKIEYNTAKQVQSVVRQLNKNGMMSELYGVTGWDFDFRGYKFQGDWQAALGVTLRVPHLSWLSMEGGAKRDYPASIGVQSPWWEEYSYLEDHFARVNSVMTRGKSVVNIGVIHPVESYLVSMGPNSITSETRRRLDENFSSNAKLLLESNLDFDYISESLIAIESDYKDALCYGAIIVSGALCLRQSTVDFLLDYQNNGGRVIFTGEMPYCIDGENEDLFRLYKASEYIELGDGLVSSLENLREVDITTESGRKMIYQLRREECRKWLFAAFSEKCGNVSKCDNTKIRIRGEYKPTLCDTLLGNMIDVAYSVSDGWTELDLPLYNSDSILLMLDSESRETCISCNDAQNEVLEDRKCNCAEIKADELNPLLLDYAEYSFDGNEYFPNKNILKIDHEYRNKIGIPFRWNRDRSQPWKSRSLGEIVQDKYLYLRFRIESEIEYEGAYLALEGLERTEITLNGEKVDITDMGYYVDKSIRKIALPQIVKGENILDLKIKIIYSNIKGAEYCYLLGDFGVMVDGDRAKIVEKCENADFSSARELKMPFYGGNITYRCREVFKKDCKAIVKVPEYAGATIRVYLDGEDKGVICFAPYTLDLGEVQKGEHMLSFKLYGNRYNTFGSLHCKKDSIGEWPAAWQSDPPRETHEYLLKGVGILDRPHIICMN